MVNTVNQGRMLTFVVDWLVPGGELIPEPGVSSESFKFRVEKITLVADLPLDGQAWLARTVTLDGRYVLEGRPDLMFTNCDRTYYRPDDRPADANRWRFGDLPAWVNELVAAELIQEPVR